MLTEQALPSRPHVRDWPARARQWWRSPQMQGALVTGLATLAVIVPSLTFRPLQTFALLLATGLLFGAVLLGRWWYGLLVAAFTIAIAIVMLPPSLGLASSAGFFAFICSGVSFLVRDLRTARQRHRTLALEYKEIAAREVAARQAALDAIIMTSTTALGVVIAWNPAAERLFGYSAQEALGKNFVDLIMRPHDRAAHHAGVARYLAGHTSPYLGRRQRVYARDRSGAEIPIELTVVDARIGDVTYFTAYIRDARPATATAAAEVPAPRPAIPAMTSAAPRPIGQEVLA